MLLFLGRPGVDRAGSSLVQTELDPHGLLLRIVPYGFIFLSVTFAAPPFALSTSLLSAPSPCTLALACSPFSPYLH